MVIRGCVNQRFGITIRVEIIGQFLTYGFVEGFGDLQFVELVDLQLYLIGDVFNIGDLRLKESELCIAGEVLRGLKKPGDCPAFGKQCKPEHPLGAPMVSSEGACAAYYRYKKSVN